LNFLTRYAHHTNMKNIYSNRLNEIREILKDKNLDGFFVPMSDEYQNEYISDHDKRIEFLSGFTGSAGFILILIDKAIFFTDSRYIIQSEKQISSDLYKIYDISDMSISKWIEENLNKDTKIGFDQKLHTTKQIEKFKKISLIPLNENPVDLIWKDQPKEPSEIIFSHDIKFAGEASIDKRRKICESLRKNNISAVIITNPSSVAWLLNVRGNDIKNTPLPLSTLILSNNENIEWFVDSNKITSDLQKTLDKKIKIYSKDDFELSLKQIGKKQSSIQIDPDLTSYFVLNTLSNAGANIIRKQDPCILPRACKNKTEIKGMIKAHETDGIALVRFLCWLDNKIKNNEKITELSITKKLYDFRSKGENFKDLSFPTIACAGSNGAIIHYMATKETDHIIKKGEFLLLDSGAQYLEGTTDVTRTIPIGDVTDEMKDRYTRVLKGHISLAKARFPYGITGEGIDILARQYLWDIGLDYGHGTGHGVGSYLCVHEGPQNISRHGKTKLEPSMVISNEPGYYEKGKYGIRHENLQYIVKLESINMLGFRPLTLAPFDKKAIIATMLTDDEKAWINEYHSYVFETISPHLNNNEKDWLKTATNKL